jgi:hypothetical protein
MAFSADGTRLAPGGAGRSPRVRVRDTASWRQLLEVRPGRFVTAAAFSPDGSRLATGNGDKAARIWSVAELSRDGCGRGLRSGLIRRPSRRCVRADRHGQVPGVLLDRAPAEPAQRVRIPLADGAAEVVSRHDLPGPGAVRRREQVRGGSAPGTLLSPGGLVVLLANLLRNPSGTLRICDEVTSWIVSAGADSSLRAALPGLGRPATEATLRSPAAVATDRRR